MSLAILKVVGSTVVTALYLAAVIVGWVVSESFDIAMAISLFGGILSGGAILGINTIED